MPASGPTLAYSVRRSVACRADLEHIFDYLLRTYQDLGDPLGKAFERAVHRIAGIEAGMDQLGQTPHQGTLWPQVMDGLRWTTKDRAILYFVVDDSQHRVDVLAVFFGGQDHKAHMLARIMER